MSTENSLQTNTMVWLFYSIVANELRIIYGSIRGVKVSCRTRSSVESLSKTRTPLVLHSFNFYQELPKISYVLKIFPAILSKFRSDKICQELPFISIFSELSSIEILMFEGFEILSIYSFEQYILGLRSSFPVSWQLTGRKSWDQRGEKKSLSHLTFIPLNPDRHFEHWIIASLFRPFM